MMILDTYISKDFLCCIETRWISSEDTLVVYIDSSSNPKLPVDLKCCESIHRKIFKDEALNLELTGIIGKDFNLEISSPGINRPLRRVQDFSSFLGSRIELIDSSNGKNKKTVTGILKKIDESLGSIEVEDDGEGSGKNLRSFRIKDLVSVDLLEDIET